MDNRIPDTLLEHPAGIRGKRYWIAPRSPESNFEFAEYLLRKRKATDPRRIKSVMKNGRLDRIAHDAAWLRQHAQRGLRVIAGMPTRYGPALRKLWAHAFHAGERHESITVNIRHLADVQASHMRRTSLPAKAREAKKPKITVSEYKAASQKAGSSRKKLFSLLEMSPQGVRDFENRHPELKTK